MFQFPWFPPLALCVQARVTPHDGCRVSPFGHPRIEAWSAAPRGLSQPPTSFIGFRRQGIHRWLFIAWRTKMLVLAMQFSKGGRADLEGPGEASAAGAERCGVMRLSGARKSCPQKTEQRSRRNEAIRAGGRVLRPLTSSRRRIASDQLGVSEVHPHRMVAMARTGTP